MLSDASHVVIAEAVLALHVAIIAFNVAGLFVIPIGGWLRWRLVRVFWLRLLHLGLFAVVAGQALAGRLCVLTIWQGDLMGQNTASTPMIMRWVDQLIFWNLPAWVFTLIYVLLFAYVASLWIVVPPRRRTSLRAVPGS